MVKRWQVGSGLLLVLAAVALMADARWGAAQAGIREGAFVVAQDGSRWVVGNGGRHRIDWTFDDTNVVPSLREGRAVATVCEAAAALGGRDPATACAGGAAGSVTTVVAPAPMATVATPAPVAAGDGSILLDASGGYSLEGPDPETASFTLATTTRVQLCWELRDPQPVLPGRSPLFNATIWQREAGGDSPTNTGTFTNESEDGCSSATPVFPLEAGTYFVRISIAEFRSWRVIVRAV